MKPAAPVLILGTFTTGSGAPLSSPEVQRQLAATLLKIARPTTQPTPSAKPA
jgi:predicted pyridoxine 5'-phosphate oxidase superfamily flavin-nucleotide-binding protein